MVNGKKKPPFYHTFKGVVVWADMTGYSKLSEMMDSSTGGIQPRQVASVKGAEFGAEAVSDILSTYFGLVMDSFAKFGGDVVKGIVDNGHLDQLRNSCGRRIARSLAC